MKDALVTVIIPFYNEETHLEQAINSVLEQTYSPIEIILINDGSIDNSKEIAVSICSKHAICSLINSANYGPGNARNIGIKNANGSFIAFLDADDVLEKRALQTLVKSMEQTDLVIGMYAMQKTNKKVIKKTTWNKANTITTNEAIFCVLNNEITPTVWGKLFRTDIAKHCSFPVKTWKEDDVFILNYLKLSTTITILNKQVITINNSPTSLTRQPISITMIEDISFSYKKQIQLILPNKQWKNKIVQNQLHAFLNLFLIIKIDWYKIKNREKVLSSYQKELQSFYEEHRDTLSLKHKLIVGLLQLSNFIGWKVPLFFITIIKKQQLNSLINIKS